MTSSHIASINYSMTTTPELTVIHRGGTRHGDTLLCTTHEYQELLQLREQITHITQLADHAALISPNAHITLTDLREALR